VPRCLIILMSAAAVLAGCTVGPPYQRPEIAVEPAFGPLPSKAAAQPYGVTEAPARTAQWWAVLNDPVLDGLIEQAIAANLDVRLAAARVREARARRAVVASGQYPFVGTEALYSRERASRNAWPYNALEAPGFPWEADLYQVGFDASWELDIFGVVRRRVEAADADLEARMEDRRDVLVSVLAEVARNYVDLRGSQHELEIAGRNLAAQRETLDLTIELARRGVARQLDVSRAAAQVATTEAGLPLFRNLQWQAMHRLAVLTGRQPGALAEALAPVGPEVAHGLDDAVGV